MAFFSQPEGYIEPKNPDNLSLGYDYIYQYKDHLGNIRLSYKDVSSNSTPSLEILLENNYYPFGLKHKGYNYNQNGRDHKYGFGGKEEQDDDVAGTRLDWLDFGARNYDASIGRWMNMDPLAEKYYDKSSYIYGLNSPIFFIDPDGLEVDVTALVQSDEKEATYILVHLLADLSEISGQKIEVDTDNDGKSILVSKGCGDKSSCSDSASGYVDHLLGSEDIIMVSSKKETGTHPKRAAGRDWVELSAEHLYGVAL